MKKFEITVYSKIDEDVIVAVRFISEVNEENKKNFLYATSTETGYLLTNDEARAIVVKRDLKLADIFNLTV